MAVTYLGITFANRSTISSKANMYGHGPAPPPPATAAVVSAGAALADKPTRASNSVLSVFRGNTDFKGEEWLTRVRMPASKLRCLPDHSRPLRRHPRARTVSSHISKPLQQKVSRSAWHSAKHLAVVPSQLWPVQAFAVLEHKDTRELCSPCMCMRQATGTKGGVLLSPR